jgi:hypothetical protein
MMPLIGRIPCHLLNQAQIAEASFTFSASEVINFVAVLTKLGFEQLQLVARRALWNC